MEFIITQPILVSQQQDEIVTINNWDIIIRKVKANNESEAIGKFIINTSQIKAKEKLPVVCIDLKKLTTLN